MDGMGWMDLWTHLCYEHRSVVLITTVLFANKLLIVQCKYYALKHFVHLLHCWSGLTHQSPCTTWTSTSASEGRRTAGPTSSTLGSHITSTMGWRRWWWWRWWWWWWWWWWWLCFRCRYWGLEAEVEKTSLPLTQHSRGIFCICNNSYLDWHQR